MAPSIIYLLMSYPDLTLSYAKKLQDDPPQVAPQIQLILLRVKPWKAYIVF